MTAKDLKNALLQEAVQGKLVPQIAIEGNAKDLLEEIRKEKAKLVKEGKLKKEKPLPEITEEDIPFDIPENWCWCRLGDCVNVQSSKRVFEKDYVKSGIPFYRSKEIGELSKGNPINTELFITNDHYKKLKETVGLPQKGDILLCSIGGSIGNTWINDGRDFYYKDGNVTQICNNKFMDTVFINYYLHSELFAKQVKSEVAGSAYNALTIIKIKNLLFPLPPLVEQKRIVAAIEKFMPLIEEYGKKETELKAFNKQIGTLTKKAILQEAVQGKLVPQIAAEGNAKDLLEEIRKEKLSHGLDFANAKSGKKKSKKETALAGSNPCDISDDEIPFDIPENWCWCRLGEICNEIKRGKSPKYADKSNFLAFAQKCNVKTGGIDLGLALYLDENSITRYSETDNLVQGDIVINSTGGGTMGRVGLYETKVPAGIKGVYPDSHVTVIRSIGSINQHYLYYVLKLNQPVLEKCGTGSTNQTELKPAVLANFVIPLPPLTEQKRIVAAIENLLPLCEKLGE